ncbi:hypothetical protein AB0N17_20980 [Streptomyces sp. NPDC051133]|uniref:hypothetical protein n=1 Tax=Streptomyces sp. NPDC051133 TaxID=3155521 RepID=UPI0034350A4E
MITVATSASTRTTTPVARSRTVDLRCRTSSLSSSSLAIPWSGAASDPTALRNRVSSRDSWASLCAHLRSVHSGSAENQPSSSRGRAVVRSQSKSPASSSQWISPPVSAIRKVPGARSRLQKATSRRTHSEAADSADAMRTKWDESRNAFSMLPHTSSVTERLDRS